MMRVRQRPDRGAATCELSGRVGGCRRGRGVPGAKVYFCNGFLKLRYYVAEKDVGAWPQNSANIATVEADGEGEVSL